MGVRGLKPKQIIDTTWTPELAYVVGLIATDGCLSSDGRHIDLTSADFEQIRTFQSLLKLNHIKVGRKTRGTVSTKPYYRLQFGSVLFYRWLVEIGLTPNKSKTLGPILVPNCFFFDFLRGCFDGDGSIHAYWDVRWKNSHMFYLSIASASQDFLVWIQENTRTFCDANGSIVNVPSARVLQLRYAKRDTQLLLERMYYDAHVPHLTRKFTKTKKILTIEQRVTA